MMADFRKIERELIDALDAAGVDIRQKDGDAFTTVIPVPECGNPGTSCELAVGHDGKMACVLCEISNNLNGRIVSVSITDLAKRLAHQ